MKTQHVINVIIYLDLKANADKLNHHQNIGVK